MQLRDKTALVTGGTSGIGLAAARRFVLEGAHVFVTGRRQAELDRAAEILGAGATPIRGDVSSTRAACGSTPTGSITRPSPTGTTTPTILT